MSPIHPGEILREEFMAPLRLTVDTLARELDFELPRLKSVVRENAPMDNALAECLERRFGVSVAFWMRLQALYERDVNAPSTAP